MNIKNSNRGYNMCPLSYTYHTLNAKDLIKDNNLSQSPHPTVKNNKKATRWIVFFITSIILIILS